MRTVVVDVVKFSSFQEYLIVTFKFELKIFQRLVKRGVVVYTIKFGGRQRMDLFCSFCEQLDGAFDLEQLTFYDHQGLPSLVAEIAKEVCPGVKVSEYFKIELFINKIVFLRIQQRFVTIAYKP